MLRPDIAGAGGGGGSSRTPVIAPNTLRSTAIARVVDLVGEGEIYGFADRNNPLSCVYLNETPVANADGSLNFKRIQIDSRVGTQTQDPLKDFNGVESELGVGMELRSGTPWLHTINNTNITSVRVRLSVDALLKQNMKNADVSGYNVAYNIAISTDSGVFVTKVNMSLSGKTETKYERAHLIDLPPSTTGWAIRVTRTTPNADSSTIADTTRVESITEIIDVKLRMPMSALVALIFDSAQFPQIPSRAYRLKGRIIRVPSNYDPDTRTYTGEWDGTFQPRYTNNPAWVFYDLVTNTRYGLGHLIDTNTLDRYELYNIARYCDVMVDDGFGGLEPRFTCNVLLQTQDDALRVMQNLATVFRGVCYASQGSVVAVADAPQDSWYCYTRANVIGGKFTYSGSDRKVRHTVALVSWNDMNDMCRAKIEYVEHPDPLAILRYGVQETTVVAFATTSRGQARRLGKYILLTETMETDLVSFSVGLDGVLVPPGKVIEVEDPLRSGRNRGGRIKHAAGTVVALDRDVSLVAGDTITLIDPNGKPHVLDVSNSVGNVVTLKQPLEFSPVAQSVWIAKTDGIVAAKFRIVSVGEIPSDDEAMGYTLSAIQHAPEKFAAIEGGLLIEPPPTSSIPSPALERPKNFVFSQRDVADDNESKKAVTLSWGKVPSATEYNVRISSNNAAFVDMGTSAEMTIDVYGVQYGTIEFVVTARSSLGTSLPTTAGPYDITENAKPPGFVDRIDDAIADNTAQLVAQQALIDAAVAAALEADLKAGKALVLMGEEYDPASTYLSNDVVFIDGRMYRATKEVPMDTPPPNAEYWLDVGTVTQAQSNTSNAITQLRVDVDEQGVEFAAAITQVESGLSSVTTAIKAVGGGGNLLQDTMFTTLDSWYVSYNTATSWSALVINGAGANYHPPGINNLSRNVTVVTPAGAPTVLHISPVKSVSVEAGKKYILSAYGNPHRCVQDVFFIWRNAAGDEISRTTPANTVGSNTSSNLGNDLGAYWTRVYSGDVAPAGAVTCTIVLRSIAAPGINQPFTFWCRPMFEQVPDTQTEPSAWSAGGVEQGASSTLTLDVNGYVSGTQSLNDGKRSTFSVLATIFRVISSASSGLEWQNGYLRAYSAGIQLVLGINFGSTSNLCFWYGPNVGANNCSKSNGTIWFDNIGGAYFGGSLSAGVKKNAVQTTTTVTVGTQLVNGPFDTNGTVRQVTISFARSTERISNAFGSDGFVAGAGANTATVQVYRKIGTAAEALWQTLNVGGGVDIFNNVDARDRANSYWSGSMTVNDTSPAASTVTYRAVITAFTSQSVTHPGTINSITTTQNLAMISVEN